MGNRGDRLRNETQIIAMMSRSAWVFIVWVGLFSLMSGSPAHAQEVPSDSAHNPILWADVPDPSVIRVGDAYYMSSTTMHMSPGVPIMKSRNLVDWRLVSYV